MKKYADWTGSLDDFLQAGDYVDDEMVEFFLQNALPPARKERGILQYSEPYSIVRNRLTYSTIVHTYDGGWKYLGHCYQGKTKNKTND